MSTITIIKLVIMVLLIACSAFFSSSETALTTCSRIHMRTLADEGNKRAARVLKLTDHSSKMLSAILIGNNIANIGSSSLATTIAMDIWGSASVGLATGILTVVILIFGEITPKTMATIRAEKLSLKVCTIIYVLMTVLTPVIFVINHLAGGVMRLLGVDPKDSKRVMTEQEIRTIVDVGQENGVIEDEEREMINNVFDLDDQQASELMVPLIDMTLVQADSAYRDVLEIFREVKFTRIPVYEESPDNVIGILNMKDLLLADPDTFQIRNIMREPFFTFETKNSSELFLEMRQSSISMAIVLNEYGTTAGLITLEDLLEEIVGDIRDEFDRDKESPIQKAPNGSYLVDASLNLDDLNDALDLSLESDDYDTLGGYMIGLLDHLPRLHESVTTSDGIYMQVTAKDKNRIKWILLRLPEEKKEDESDQN